MRKYKELTTNGSFYDEFVHLYGNNITRKEVKELMFKVLFSRNKDCTNPHFISYAHEKKVFANVFPFIYSIIQLLKEKDHRQLAILLQQMESNIFIDLISKELVENGIVPITIHDSVIVPANRADESKEVMEEILEVQTWLKPMFLVEEL